MIATVNTMLYTSEVGYYGVVYKTNWFFLPDGPIQLQPCPAAKIHKVRGFTPMMVPDELAKSARLKSRIVWIKNESD